MINPLQDAARRYPHHIGLRSGETMVTYSDLLDEANQIAGALTDYGLVPGDIVAMGNLATLDQVLLIWGSIIGRFVIFPMNNRYPVENLEKLLKDVKPALVISTTEVPSQRCITFQALKLGETKSILSIGHTDNDLSATLLMTSGSSGKQKVVQHSLFNHVASARGAAENLPVLENDSWVLSLPLYHIGGLAILFRVVLSGAALVVPEEDVDLLDVIQTHQATHISLVATQLKRLLQKPEGPELLGRLKAVLLGGSAIPQRLIQMALDLELPVHVSYGSTEMASQVTTTTRGNRQGVLEHSGKVLPGRDILISAQGEILAKGDTLAKGYLEGSKLVDLRDGDGWFHTGDMGYLNVSGELTVTGRIDNQFISGGENIQPEHIERLLRNESGIHDVMVVPQQNDEFGARPVAFIEKGADPLDIEHINQGLRGLLPGYMIPIAYYEFPAGLATQGLKISRQDLIDLLSRGNKHLQTL